MSQLFIAEKPELGRAIAAALSGIEQKGEGFIKKGDCIITWAFGHILELKEPDVINPQYKVWRLEDLPLNVKLEYKPKESSSKQLKNIIQLIHSQEVHTIIHCGDADDEGQILIDEILLYAKTNKPIHRMLINDITAKAIQKELQNMRPNSAFTNISESGFARSQADYLLGMNLTRAYTLLHQKSNPNSKEVLSFGRVQTPILGLIVNRDLENKNHKVAYYYEIESKFNFSNPHLQNIPFTLKTQERTESQELAEALQAQTQASTFSIQSKTESKTQAPPLPYNLLNLQSDCAKLYGYSAKETLKITQILRETYHAISYNRSDCEYIPNTIYEERESLLKQIQENFANTFDFTHIDSNIKSKAFDDSKISAHYAIIPTETKLDLSKLNEKERKVYTLIAKRFLVQFCEKREYESTTITLKAESLLYEKTFNFTTKSGFQSFFGKEEDKEEELNLLDSPDTQTQAHSVHIQRKETKPKPHYTMATLLKDLNSVAKYVKDEKIKTLLLEKDKEKKGESGGIGTPATRAEMIETLLKRGFISISEDKKQQIRSTQKGVQFIASLPPAFTQPDLTALWFAMQKEILSGNLSREAFLQNVQESINTEIQKIKQGVATMQVTHTQEQIPCPACENGILSQKKGKYGFFWGCSNYQNGCSTIFKDNNGKPDTTKNNNNTTNYTCPQCKKGNLIRRESKNKKGSFWYGCSAFKEGCKFTCFEKDGQPVLPVGM